MDYLQYRDFCRCNRGRFIVALLWDERQSAKPVADMCGRGRLARED